MSLINALKFSANNSLESFSITTPKFLLIDGFG